MRWSYQKKIYAKGRRAILCFARYFIWFVITHDKLLMWMTLFSDVIVDIEKMEDREKNDVSYVMKIVFGPGIHGTSAVIIGTIAA